MSFALPHNRSTVYGILFVALFAAVASYLAQLPLLTRFAISPLIIGIVLGMIFGNTLRDKLPDAWLAGILFSTKTVLRAGIVFYGFRLTFQDVGAVGVAGILVSATIVTVTFVLGCFVGIKLLKLDRDTTILISAGSAICGAAAVLATEPLLKSEHYKASIAVATVVVFGTVAMFLYPFLYQSGLLAFVPAEMGVYLGGTLHEVAHVVGAGNAISEPVANTAVIVKMLRVMLLAPFLLLLSVSLSKLGKCNAPDDTNHIRVPWFAVAFIAVVAFNSLQLLPATMIGEINQLDTFALTMAMTALGMETRLTKFRGIGLKPVYLAGTLFIWLLFGGYWLTRAAFFLTSG